MIQPKSWRTCGARLGRGSANEGGPGIYDSGGGTLDTVVWGGYECSGVMVAGRGARNQGLYFNSL